MINNSCRFCQSPTRHIVLDLGVSPLANALIRPEQTGELEVKYPLCVYVCEKCFLVQLPQVESPENIFTDYLYHSSYSEGWLRHVETYVDEMDQRYLDSKDNRIVEIGSNDGYLLQYFLAKGYQVLGIEPATEVARIAEQKGIDCIKTFFNVDVARELRAKGLMADLLVANNVLAHTPDLNGFMAGMKELLQPSGIITIEVPHLLRLMQKIQFDTIYHEHFSYFSLLTLRKIFEAHDLDIFDVEQLETHGGSLRLFASHCERQVPVSDRVHVLLSSEVGMDKLATYGGFSERVEVVKQAFLGFLRQAKEKGKTVVGYGAPAKATTLLNFCGIDSNLLSYTVDRNPYKQNLLIPGARIPIYAPEKIRETRPDYVIILPWNIESEVLAQLDWIREWGGRFVVVIPALRIN